VYEMDFGEAGRGAGGGVDMVASVERQHGFRK
jgi:hypothetical protein